MKDGLAAFDLLAVVGELQGLVGGYVNTVYQRDDELALRIHVPGSGRRDLYVRPGKWIALRSLDDKPDAPPPFAMALRADLDNARVQAIEQHGFDRIVVLTFDRDLRLVLEMFGKGNVVLVRDGAVVAALRRARYKDRTIAPGSSYAFPPEAADPLAMPRDDFVSTLRAAKGSVVKALAARMNLGGPYAEEVCARASVAKTAKPSALSDEDLAGLHDAVLGLAKAIRETPSPGILFQDDSPVDLTPVPFEGQVGERRPFPSLLEAVAFLLDREVDEAPAPEDPQVAKLRRRLEEQRNTLAAAREEAVQSGGLAELLYQHYASFDDLLRKARENALAVEPPVLAVNAAKRTVRVSVGDIAEVELDWTTGVEQNAKALYDRRKEALAKAERIETAIAETEASIAKAAKRAERAVRESVAPTKRFWFEAYRWFLSSEGFLVLGGRDARSNDAVVKKHLKDGDRYVHADMRGAPSCVIKDGAKAGEATVREACAFALSWSKAWSSGLASGSAYVVNPEQVSKQAESGEHVGRGAWVIRGKRTYAHDLPVRAAVGEIEHEGHRKVMAGPVEAVQARSERYVVIEPGEEGKEAVARRLAKEFAVPVEETSRVMPPGATRIRQTIGVRLTGEDS